MRAPNFLWDKSPQESTVLSSFLPAPASPSITRGQLIVLKFSIFIKGGLLGAYIPFVTLWVSKKGYSSYQIGTIVLADAVGSLLLPLLGGALDKLRTHNLGFVVLLVFLSVLKCCYLFAAKHFVWILVLTVLTSPLLRATNSLLDALALYALTEKGEFGRVRVYGDIGFGCIVLLVGIAIQWSRTEDAMFIGFSVLCGTLAIVWGFASTHMHSIRPDTKPMPWAEFFVQVRLLRDRFLGGAVFRALALLAIMGGVQGLIATYEFVLLDSLMGNGLLLGLCKLVGTIASIPVWWFVAPAMDMVGFKNVQLCALACSGMRLGILGVIDNPWYALLSESLSGVGGFALAYPSITILSGRLVNEDLKGTVQTTIFVIFTGIGSGLSPLLVSSIVKSNGTQAMFIDASVVVAFVTAAVAAFDVIEKCFFGTYCSLEASLKV